MLKRKKLLLLRPKWNKLNKKRKKRKQKKNNEKENKKNGLEETGYVNVDNDDEEFASAEEEVLEDIEEHEKTKMIKADKLDRSGYLFDFLKANDGKDDLGQSRTQTYYEKVKTRPSYIKNQLETSAAPGDRKGFSGLLADDS